VVKSLSQAGISLSDVYDIEGSIVGVEQLLAEDVTLNHEMGGTIFSERLSGAIRRQTTGAITQTTSFDLFMLSLPAGIYRIIGAKVTADVAGRVANVNLSVVNVSATGALGQEMPFFVWDEAVDAEVTLRTTDLGPAAANFIGLVTDRVQTPLIGISTGQPQVVGSQIAMRGNSATFGAGNVVITAQVLVAFSQISGISSIGLPIPGW